MKLKTICLLTLFFLLYIFDLITFNPNRELNPFVTEEVKYLCLIIITLSLASINFLYPEKINFVLCFLIAIYGFAFAWNLIVIFI